MLASVVAPARAGLLRCGLRVRECQLSTRLNDERNLHVHVVLRNLAVVDDRCAVQDVDSGDVPQRVRCSRHGLLGSITPALVRDPHELNDSNDTRCSLMLSLRSHDDTPFVSVLGVLLEAGAGDNQCLRLPDPGFHNTLAGQDCVSAERALR